MRVTRITPHIQQLTRLGLVNAFLVQEQDGFTLVDTGVPGSAKRILAQIRAHSGTLRRVVLTHAHSDHAGSLDELTRMEPGIEILVYHREERLLRRDFTLDAEKPHSKIRGHFPKLETRPTTLLQDGDHIASLQVVAAPGHTPGHIALLDTRSAALLCGDAFMAVGPLRVSFDSPWYMPITKPATWNWPISLATAQRLAELHPAWILPGHGHAVSAPGPALGAALERAEKTLRHFWLKNGKAPCCQ